LRNSCLTKNIVEHLYLTANRFDSAKDMSGKQEATVTSETPADTKTDKVDTTTDKPLNLESKHHGLVAQVAINTATAIKEGAVAAGHAIAGTQIAHTIVDGACKTGHAAYDGTVNTGHAIADSVRAAASSASEKAHAVKEVVVEDAIYVKDKVAEEYMAVKDYVVQNVEDYEEEADKAVHAAKHEHVVKDDKIDRGVTDPMAGKAEH